MPWSGNSPFSMQWNIKKCLGLELYKNHTKEQQEFPLLYCVFSITKCLTWNPCWLFKPEEQHQKALTEPYSGFWESSAALKSSITGRISPASVHSESAAEAATVSRRHHSKYCRAQHEQHAVLIFLPHTGRKSSSTRHGAVSCLQNAPPPILLGFLSDVLVWK